MAARRAGGLRRSAGDGAETAVTRALYPVRSGWSQFQPLEVLPDRIAEALAARDRRAADAHQDEVAARRAADFLHVAHVHQARAADAQHRLRLEGALRLPQRAARV